MHPQVAGRERVVGWDGDARRLVGRDEMDCSCESGIGVAEAIESRDGQIEWRAGNAVVEAATLKCVAVVAIT